MKELLKQNSHALFQRPHDRLPALDGIRAIAIIMVVGVHLIYLQGSLTKTPHSSYDTSSYIIQLQESRLARILVRGEFGVDLFFVLSGFLIGSILLKELDETKTINLKRFYTRRFIRLIPVYFVVMFAGYLAYRVWLPDMLEGKTAWTYLANVLYINNFLSMGEMYMPWCWSLAIEEQFYTICPLFLLGLFFYAKTNRMKTTLFASTVVLMLLVRGAVISYLDLSAPVLDLVMGDETTYAYWDYVYIMPHTRLNALLIGVFCAFIYINYRDQVRRVSECWWFQLIQITAFLLMCWLATDWIYTIPKTYIGDLPAWGRFLYLVTFHDLFALATATLFLGVLTGKGFVYATVGKVLESKFWFPIAQLSYSWYLVHMIVMDLIYPHSSQWLYDQFGLETGFWLNGIMASMAGLFLSYVLFVFIEKPTMDLRRSDMVKRFHG